MLSNPTRTACGACEAGQYTAGTACIGCPEGTFAPSAQEHACITCSAGSSTNLVTSATSCSPCQSGRASTNNAGENAGTEGCKICAAGKSAAFGQFRCLACEAGKYSAEPGSATCEACQAGKISSSESSSTCESCEPGKSAAGAGQSACLACEAGRYSAEPGSATCEACQAGAFSSTEGSDACSPCPASHRDSAQRET